MRRVGVIIGTRPEAIKLAPVVRALSETEGIEVIVIATGQHREMLHQMFESLGLTPNVDLDLMKQGQDLAQLTTNAIAAISRTLAADRYDAIVVQGDTTTAMCGALSAFYSGVPVAHVEAGLRSGWSTSPFPEEANRRMIGDLARWHFAPTPAAAAAVANAPEPKRVVVTGNTAIDTLLWAMNKLGIHSVSDGTGPVRRVLVTLHRRETQGDRQIALCRMIRRLTQEYGLLTTLPVHPNPNVAAVVRGELEGAEGVRLVEPLDYFGCVREMAQSDLILTDSGGIQEEAPTLSVPVLVMRDTTERAEGVECGCAVLVGADADGAEAAIGQVIEDQDLRRNMARARNPYGDGRAAKRIASVLAEDLLGTEADSAVAHLGGAWGATDWADQAANLKSPHLQQF